MFFDLYFRYVIYNFVGSNCDFVPQYEILGNYSADSQIVGLLSGRLLTRFLNGEFVLK